MKLWFKAGEDVDKACTHAPQLHNGQLYYVEAQCCTVPTVVAFVQDMKARFGHLLQHAAKTGLPEWQRHHNGLAAVLLMDQFSR